MHAFFDVPIEVFSMFIFFDVTIEAALDPCFLPLALFEPQVFNNSEYGSFILILDVNSAHTI
jgi:hypothetical protein